MLNEDLRQHTEEQLIKELKKITDWYRTKQWQMLLDDVIGVFTGNIVDYNHYVEKRSEKEAEELSDVLIVNDDGSITLNVEPMQLTKEQFDYIKAKRKERKRGY